MHQSVLLVTALALPILSCGVAPDSDPSTECITTEPTALQGEWENGIVTRFTIANGDPDHSVQDVVAHPEKPFTLKGKFAYGPASKDLEHEEVAGFIRTDGCAQWALVGEAITDGDGRAEIDVDGLLSQPGRYDFRMIVRGEVLVTSIICRNLKRRLLRSLNQQSKRVST